jgi:hypothetical protein
MNMNLKKSLKLITLLISALLIGTVSATIYNYMSMNSTGIGVKSTYDVNFYAGADYSSAGGSITNNRQTVTFTNMQGPNGSLATYSDPVRICNNSTLSKTYNVELAFDSWTFGGNALTTLQYANITVFSSSTTRIGSMSLIPAGGGNTTAGAHDLTALDWYRVQWDIMWYPNATAGTDTANIYLKITVHD